MSQSLCNDLMMKMLNAGWSRADITQLGHLYVVSAKDPHGREHSGARSNAEALVSYLIEIGALPPIEQRKPTPTVSPQLAVLLAENESLEDGKSRLLVEYDSLTQRLHDEKYEMSRSETQRHEAISAILLELRG